MRDRQEGERLGPAGSRVVLNLGLARGLTISTPSDQRSTNRSRRLHRDVGEDGPHRAAGRSDYAVGTFFLGSRPKLDRLPDGGCGAGGRSMRSRRECNAVFLKMF